MRSFTVWWIYASVSGAYPSSDAVSWASLEQSPSLQLQHRISCMLMKQPNTTLQQNNCYTSKAECVRTPIKWLHIGATLDMKQCSASYNEYTWQLKVPWHQYYNLCDAQTTTSQGAGKFSRTVCKLGSTNRLKSLYSVIATSP